MGHRIVATELTRRLDLTADQQRQLEAAREGGAVRARRQVPGDPISGQCGRRGGHAMAGRRRRLAQQLLAEAAAVPRVTRVTRVTRSIGAPA